MHNPIIQRLLYLVIDFERPFWFGLNAHGVVPYLIYLRFDLEAPTGRVEVLFFTYNMLVKIHSDCLALGFLTGVDVMGDMGLSFVNPSGAETKVASIISLNCYWWSIYKIVLPQVVLAGDKMIVVHLVIYLR